MNNRMEMMLKEATVLLSQHVLRGTEENYKESQAGLPIEIWTSDLLNIKQEYQRSTDSRTLQVTSGFYYYTVL
jgi:hypothetical protein